jgi:hypothetical protein
MAFQYTREISELGKMDDCWVCLESIDIGRDCVICDNGHRTHRHCYDNLPSKVCGICRALITRNCYTNIYGYGYIPRIGDKTTTRDGVSYLRRLPRGGTRRTRTRTRTRRIRRISNKRKKNKKQ